MDVSYWHLYWMISCLLLLWYNVFAQNVSVNLSLSSGKALVGEDIWINCTAHGILQQNDKLVISKSGGNFVALDTDVTRKQDDIAEKLCYLTPHALGKSSNCSLKYSIGSVNQSDTGNYTCTILRNSTFLARDTIFLEINLKNLSDENVIPPVCYSVPSGSVFYEGDIIELHCLTPTVNSNIRLGWSRSDNRIVPSNNLTDWHKDHTVTISLTLHEDGLIFTCYRKGVHFPGFKDKCSLNALSIMPRLFNESTPATNYSTPAPAAESGWSSVEIALVTISFFLVIVTFIYFICITICRDNSYCSDLKYRCCRFILIRRARRRRRRRRRQSELESSLFNSSFASEESKKAKYEKHTSWFNENSELSSKESNSKKSNRNQHNEDEKSKGKVNWGMTIDILASINNKICRLATECPTYPTAIGFAFVS